MQDGVSHGGNRDLTGTLRLVREGDRSAADEFMPLIYDELRRLAAARLGEQEAGFTLTPTAIAHEAYLRLVDQSRTEWQDRVHFFAIAAHMVRRVLVDYARHRGAAKRGGRRQRFEVDEADAIHDGPDPDLLALDEALEELGRMNDRQRQIVELRFFGGLSIAEAAEVLGVSPTLVKGEWAMARAWLRERLAD